MKYLIEIAILSTCAARFYGHRTSKQLPHLSVRSGIKNFSSNGITLNQLKINNVL